MGEKGNLYKKIIAVFLLATLCITQVPVVHAEEGGADGEAVTYTDETQDAGGNQTNGGQTNGGTTGQETIGSGNDDTAGNSTDGSGTGNGGTSECTHVWNDSYTVDVEADCTKEGQKSKHCSKCGDIKPDSVQKIEKLSHTGKQTITKATPSADGKIVNKCTKCGTAISTTVIARPKTVTLSAAAYTYNGKAKTPSVSVTDSNGKKLSSGNYTVSYSSGRKNVGRYNVKVTFKGNYSGSITKTFDIRPKTATLTRTFLNNKKLAVNWDKQSSQTTGYQIQYASDSRFTKSVKTTTVSKNSTTFKAISKVNGKKYYVRIRTYKKTSFGGKSLNIYSGWSKVKTATKKKVVALTFDDGPGPKTGKLLNQLDKYNSHATFFVVGNRVSRYKSTIKKMNSIGCEVGNHSYTHANLGRSSSKKIRSEIKKTNSKVKAITKTNPVLMRPPYGSVSKTLRSKAGMPLIMWSIDTLDWKTKNSQKTINKVMKNVKDGDIVLMHDIHSATITAGVKLIPKLKKKGYELVTVSEMAAIKGVKLKKGGRYSKL